MQKVCLLNLGCRVNQYEIDSILNSLKGEYEVTTNLEPADVYIVNTCAVTTEAEKKSRQIISKIEKVNPNGKIYIMGCASQNNPQQFLEKKQVELVLGTFGKGKIKDYLKMSGNHVCSIPQVYEDDFFATNVRTRGYIKIQDGCNNYCSYCLIPFVRGRSRSRSLNSIVLEAQELSKTCHEIVLTGINLSDYKLDGKLALAEVLRSLYNIPSRIRLSSLEVNVITEEFLNVVKNMPNFCPSFHLCLQSGSDKVLNDMNRHYTTKEYLNKVNLIRRYFPNANITTDLIVGFPTETDKEFENTLNFIKQVGFSSVHYFAYSSRPGTRAGKMPQINGKTIKEREGKLKLVCQELRKSYLQKFVGIPLTVLVEEKNGSYYEGFSDNYLKCYLDFNANKNTLIKVMPVCLYEDGLMCKELE